MTHASEKVGFIYKYMLALLAYHHAYGPVTIAQEHTLSLEALLKVRLLEKTEEKFMHICYNTLVVTLTRLLSDSTFFLVFE